MLWKSISFNQLILSQNSKKCHIYYPSIAACKHHQSGDFFGNDSIGEQEVASEAEAVEDEAVVEGKKEKIKKILGKMMTLYQYSTYLRYFKARVCRK